MATIITRGPYQYQAKVRRNGYPLQSKTFEHKQDALDWAAMIESEMRRGVFVDRTELEHTTLGGILQRYKKEIAPTQKRYVNPPCPSKNMAHSSSGKTHTYEFGQERLHTLRRGAPSCSQARHCLCYE